MNEKLKYLTTNTLVFAISSFGTKFLSFVLVPLYTNVLTTAEYGIADIIVTTATLMIFLFTVNIADSVLRFGIEAKSGKQEILSYGMRVIGIGSLLAAGVLTVVALSGLVDWKTEYYVFLFLYYFFTALYQTLANYMRAADKVKDVAIGGIISSVAMIGCNLLFLLVIKIGLMGYLIGLVAGHLAGTVYFLLRGKITLPYWGIRLCDKETRHRMMVYCMPLILNSVALWVNSFLSRFFITGFCGAGANGIYSVANKIPVILSTCYTVFSQAWGLSAIREFDPEDTDGFFAGTYKVYNALICMACSGLIILNVPIAKLLFAKDFFVAWEYSSLLLLSVMFNALTVFMGSIFTAVKNTKILATTTLFSAVVNIGLNLLLVPKMGVMGAALANFTSYVVMWVVRLVYAKKYIKMKINLAKDVLVYVLLLGQVVLEHRLPDHGYVWQGLIFVGIVLLNGKQFVEILKKLFSKFLSKKG